MLSLLDNLLRQVLMQGVRGLQTAPVTPPLGPPPVNAPVIADQVGFRPPDDQWVTDVENLQLNALNVYLVDLRENRRLRSNERDRGIDHGIPYTEAAPVRMDCHYLITAWTSVKYITPTVEPVLDEHALLYETAAVLIRAGALNPSRVFPPSPSPLDDWPARFQNVDFPIVVAPPDGFVKLAEFWGTMGQNHRWKPAVYLIVTLPIELVHQVAGPMVTTRITEYGQMNRPGSGEIWIQIGGTVYNNAGVAVPRARVELVTPGGQLLQHTEANELGRFTFSNLRAGSYALSASAVGLGRLPAPRSIDVPSATGEYDVKFP